jgi:hypothetical protein
MNAKKSKPSMTVVGVITPSVEAFVKHYESFKRVVDVGRALILVCVTEPGSKGQVSRAFLAKYQIYEVNSDIMTTVKCSSRLYLIDPESTQDCLLALVNLARVQCGRPAEQPLQLRVAQKYHKSIAKYN